MGAWEQELSGGLGGKNWVGLGGKNWVGAWGQELGGGLGARTGRGLGARSKAKSHCYKPRLRTTLLVMFT